jgi:hypothetical protein
MASDSNSQLLVISFSASNSTGLTSSAKTKDEERSKVIAAIVFMCIKHLMQKSKKDSNVQLRCMLSHKKIQANSEIP